MKRTYAEFIVLCGQVRSYLAVNHGKTKEEIYQAVTGSEGSGALTHLASRGYIKFRGRNPARWEAVPQ